MQYKGLGRALLAIGGLAISVDGRAAIDLRVDPKPIGEPIQASILVTNGFAPIGNLSAGDFAVTLDGAPVANFTLTRPRSAGGDLAASVAIVKGGFDAHSTGYSDVIGALTAGDRASILTYRFRPIIEGTVVYLSDMPFAAMDDAGTEAALGFLETDPEYFGTYMSFDGVSHVPSPILMALDQFASPPVPLPAGRRVLIGDTRIGRGRFTSLIDRATGLGVSLFDVAFQEDSAPDFVAQQMASRMTGGVLVPIASDLEFDAAIARIQSWINDSYRLAIPSGAVADCGLHALEITARGQSVVSAFARCDATPDQFEPGFFDGVTPNSTVVSNPITLTGLESPTEIQVIDGEYSIGCGSTFTRDPGFIQPSDVVCVRHQATGRSNDFTESTLVIGGEYGWLQSQTKVAPPPPPPPPPPENGGGGPAGLPELLLLVALLFLQGNPRPDGAGARQTTQGRAPRARR